MQIQTNLLEKNRLYYLVSDNFTMDSLGQSNCKALNETLNEIEEPERLILQVTLQNESQDNDR